MNGSRIFIIIIISSIIIIIIINLHRLATVP